MPENPFLYLQRNADERPTAAFLRTPTRTISNADAVVEVKKLAYELRRLGVTAGQVVALDVPDALSVVFTEAIYHEAAISTVIPPGHVVGEAFRVDWVFSSRAAHPQGDARMVPVDATFLQRVAENPYGIRPSEEPIETLRIVFSSGTTGRPKAVALGRDMERAMDAALDSWVQAAPSLCLMDTGTVAGVGEFFLSVKAGVPYLSTAGHDDAAIVRLIDAAQVRTLRGSPNQLAALVDELDAQGRTIPSVATVISSGTFLPPRVAERIRAVTEGCMLLTGYGSTEAGSGAQRVYTSADPYDAGQIARGTTLEIVDDQHRPVPAGVTGRIRYRSFGMATGYLGDPEATASAFHEGWFYPGDLGHLREDGGLTLAGRESERLNAGGVKVDPSRIDHVALGHPGVREASSFAFPDESGLDRIGLAIVADEDVDTAALVQLLAREFTVAAPSLVVRVGEIPRTATGKPRRGELAALIAAH